MGAVEEWPRFEAVVRVGVRVERPEKVRPYVGPAIDRSTLPPAQVCELREKVKVPVQTRAVETPVRG